MKSLNYEEVKTEIEKLTRPPLKIFILLYRPNSEMNIGHIFRLADAAGIIKVYLYQPKENIKWHKIEKLSRKNSRHIEYEIITELNELPDLYSIALEWTDESKSIYDYKLDQKQVLLVVGNEKKGLSSEILDLCNTSIHIPMYGQHSSMNMAMAAGIAVYGLLSS